MVLSLRAEKEPGHYDYDSQIYGRFSICHLKYFLTRTYLTITWTWDLCYIDISTLIFICQNAKWAQVHEVLSYHLMNILSVGQDVW